MVVVALPPPSQVVLSVLRSASEWKTPGGGGHTSKELSSRGWFTYLMELLTSDREAARALVAAASGASEGTLGLVFMAIPGTGPAELAKAAGMRAIPRKLEDNPLTFCVTEYEGSRPEVKKKWSAAFGDLDYL